MRGEQSIGLFRKGESRSLITVLASLLLSFLIVMIFLPTSAQAATDITEDPIPWEANRVLNNTSETINIIGCKVTVDGDLYIDGSKVNLVDGGMLYVKGDLYLEKGSLSVSENSTVEVDGSLLVYCADGAGDYTGPSTGSLSLKKLSTIIVNCDFYHDTTGSYSLQGDLFLGGNYTCKNNKENGKTEWSGNVVLLGENRSHTVTLKTNTAIASLTSENPNVIFENYLNVGLTDYSQRETLAEKYNMRKGTNVVLSEDIIVATEQEKLISTSGIKINDQTRLEVPVDLVTQSDVILGNGSVLKVSGNMRAEKGKVSLAKSATMEISKSLWFEIIDANGVLNTSEASFIPDTGSKTIVGEDFVYNSTGTSTNLKGNLELYGDYTCKMTKSWVGNVLLNGSDQTVILPVDASISDISSKHQTVKFGEYLNFGLSSSINIVPADGVDTFYVTKDLTVNKECGLTVPCDLVVYSNVTLNDGATMKVEGDLEARSGKISLKKSATLETTGSMWFEIIDGDDKLATTAATFFPEAGSKTVVGKDYVYSSNSTSSGLKGDIYVSGDYTCKSETSGAWTGNVYMINKGKTVEASKQITKLYLTGTKGEYTIKPADCYKELVENWGEAGVVTVQMLRLYNPNSGEHFYTDSEKEKKSLVKAGWQYEDIGWIAPRTGAPVYRLYNENAGDHHYTTSKKERDNLIEVGWKDEGIGWYSATKEEGKPLYRLYNPNCTGAGSHHYTLSEKEKKKLIEIGWRDEGIAWYAVK